MKNLTTKQKNWKTKQGSWHELTIYELQLFSKSSLSNLVVGRLINVYSQISKKTLYMPRYVWNYLRQKLQSTMIISVLNRTPIIPWQFPITNDRSYWKACGKGIAFTNYFRWYSIWQGREGSVSSLLMSTSKPFDTTLVHRSNYFVTITATFDCNERTSPNKSPDYIRTWEGTNGIHSAIQTCYYVFTNVKRASLPTGIGSPNSQMFNSGRTLLARANARMLNPTEAINPRYGICCGIWPRSATSRWWACMLETIVYLPKVVTFLLSPGFPKVVVFSLSPRFPRVANFPETVGILSPLYFPWWRFFLGDLVGLQPIFNCSMWPRHCLLQSHWMHPAHLIVKFPWQWSQ